jgi:predicted porin
MKKTLIAIAAIAAMGAASAQVTAYGKLDAGIFNTAAGGTVVGLSGYETSRFGIKGEQKMGGLTLSGQLEGKVNDSATRVDGEGHRTAEGSHTKLQLPALVEGTSGTGRRGKGAGVWLAAR